jgi:hypothetical protein
MMRVLRRAGALLLGCLVLTVSVGVPQAADAAPSSGSAIDDAALRKHMRSLGISADVQQHLVEKLTTGEPLDSMTGHAPVSTEVSIEGGYRVTTDTYADGSVGKTGYELGRPATRDELERMEVAAAPFASPAYRGDSIDHQTVITPDASVGITGCMRGRDGGVVYAQNCHIYYNGVSASNSFDANYQQYPGVGKAQYIEGTAKFVSFVVSVSNEHVDVYDDGSRIRYSFTTSFNGLGSIPGFLQLEVTGSGAHVTRG